MKTTKNQLEKALELACRYLDENDGKDDFWPLNACSEDCEEPSQFACQKCLKEYFLQKAKGD